MCALSQFAIRFFLGLCLVSVAFAQVTTPANHQGAPLIVTATASSDRVRFTSPSSVVQIRLEVYNSTGNKVFDNEVRGGNTLDWHLEDGQAERLADAIYLCSVTVKSLAGRLTQRIGSVTFEKGAVSVEGISLSEMTAQQTQAIGPVEEEASLVALKEDHPRTPTVIAHNGEDGQITRGRGALSFRIGDFFRGKDIEQMRLTAEGNLGLGITHPTVKLDVDGLVRTSQGIVFPDGSVQFSAARKTLGTESLRAGQSPHAHAQHAGTFAVETSGIGTTGRIPRWLDGPAGVLTDSNIAELNGSIGINGSPNNNFKLDVNGSALYRGSNPGFNLVGLRPAGNQWVFQTVDDDGRFRLFGQDNVNPGVERFTISLSTGNVGIGVTQPVFKLHLADASNHGLRVQTTVGGGNVASFGGNGDFSIDAVNVPSGRLIVKEAGNVGVGTASPQARLDVRGDVKLGSNGQLFAPGGVENLRIVRGVVGSSGNIIVGSGFAASNTSAGHYTITFNTPFSAPPSVTATVAFSGAVRVIETGAVTGSSAIIHTFFRVDGTFGDATFHFTAIGPR